MPTQCVTASAHYRERLIVCLHVQYAVVFGRALGAFVCICGVYMCVWPVSVQRLCICPVAAWQNGFLQHIERNSILLLVLSLMFCVSFSCSCSGLCSRLRMHASCSTQSPPCHTQLDPGVVHAQLSSPPELSRLLFVMPRTTHTHCCMHCTASSMANNVVWLLRGCGVVQLQVFLHIPASARPCPWSTCM